MSDVIGLPDRTTSAVENLLADFGMELFAAPTPCTERTVSELLDHLATGARMFASVASGNAPATDAQQSEPSDDPRLRYAKPGPRWSAPGAGEGSMARCRPVPSGKRQCGSCARRRPGTTSPWLGPRPGAREALPRR
jgi:hypothetical protein